MLGVKCHSVLLVVTGILCISPIYASRVLLLAAQQVSHVMEQVVVGEVLVERGHQVYALMDSKYPKLSLMEQAGITPILYEEPEGAPTLLKIIENMEAEVFDFTVDKFKIFGDIMEVSNEVCGRILHNKALMRQLESLDFDLVLNDGFLLHPCLLLIPHTLKVPYILMSSGLPDLFIGNPVLPSAFGTPLSVDFYPPMSLTEKLQNAMQHVSQWMLGWFAMDGDLMAEFAPGVSSVFDLMRKSELFIATRDHILEWPMPRLPNILCLPGITSIPARDLSPDVQKVMDDADSVVVMSFGSSIDAIPQELLEKLLLGMEQIKQVTFLFRISKETVAMFDKMPDNVKPMGWLPQNDVLAHPNTKLFITHCGNNGQYEAVYHGVPMIGFPSLCRTASQLYEGGDEGARIVHGHSKLFPRRSCQQRPEGA